MGPVFRIPPGWVSGENELPEQDRKGTVSPSFNGRTVGPDPCEGTSTPITLKDGSITLKDELRLDRR